MARVSHQELCNRTAQETGMTQSDTRMIVDTYFGQMAGSFTDENDNTIVEIPGVATFEEIDVPGGSATPPGQTQAYNYSAFKRIVVRIGSGLKNAINGKSSSNLRFQNEQPELYQTFFDNGSV
jgi:nucleoid DNA-binding protein